MRLVRVSDPTIQHMEKPAGLLSRMQFYKRMGGVVVINTTVQVSLAIWVGG